MSCLDFEKPYFALEEKIAHLLSLSPGSETDAEIKNLKAKQNAFLKQIYKKLTPWQTVMVARHADRPKMSNYIRAMMEDFIPLCGDRLFGEDVSILGGLATFRGKKIMVIGHEKGMDTSSRVKHNFGMAHPEGYRKAVRLMDMAERFCLPIITFIDTPGAYAGIAAEERGQSNAIAHCMEKSLSVHVPILSVIIGEGGSGGAIALATSNHVSMLRYAVYSVISPEGCASILWRTQEKKEEAALAQKLTAPDLLQLNIIDSIIEEPVGGAHLFPEETIKATADSLEKTLLRYGKGDHKAERRARFLAIGQSYVATAGL